MPDLPTLLTAEAHRLAPDSVPAFDDLLARGRRRRASRAVAAVSSVVVLVVGITVGGGWLSSRSSTKVPISASTTGGPTTAAPTTAAPTTAATIPVTAPAVQPEVYERLRTLAVALATNNGDPNPTRLEAVMVNPTRPAASRQLSPSSPPLTGGYLLEVQGRFVCTFCKGHAEPQGTVITQQLSAPALAVVTTGFGGPWQDLTRYGTPFSLTSPAAPGSPSAPSSPSLSGSPSASGSPADLTVNELLQRNFRASAANKKYVACMKSHGFPGEIDPYDPPKAVMASEDGTSGSPALANRYRAAWHICVKVAHI